MENIVKKIIVRQSVYSLSHDVLRTKFKKSKNGLIEFSSEENPQTIQTYFNFTKKIKLI